MGNDCLILTDINSERPLTATQGKAPYDKACFAFFTAAFKATLSDGEPEALNPKP